MNLTLQPVPSSQRINVLDMLRGIAIFGMIISHAALFSGEASSTAGKLFADASGLFIDGRFYTIFAILFGAGFAIQFRNAEAKNESFVSRFLRRLLALFCFGIFAEILFGFSVLAEYALAGLLLLIVRRWSTKKLIVLFLICIVAQRLTTLAYSYVYVAQNGSKQYISKLIQRNKEARKTYQMKDNATTYAAAMQARFQQIKLRHDNPINTVFGWMFVNLAYFILGLIGIRLGVFQQPAKHRRLILSLMGIGLATWAIYNWIIPLIFPGGVPYFYPRVSLLKAFTRSAADGFSLIREDWLAFTYIGAILLVSSYKPNWLRRLSFFGYAGQIALTNYMLQAMLFSSLFCKYALGLPSPDPVYIPVIALLFFGILALFSYWWLTLYRFGPFEWMLRSFTYWKWQPMKKKETIQNTEMAL